MINSVNFIDGLDGLLDRHLAHRRADAGRHLARRPLRSSRWWRCCARCWPGALLGFLPWNFHPARVFIGTAGVFAVGYALAVLSILGTAKVAVALLVLGVPIIDTFWIIIRRVPHGSRRSRPIAATSTTGCWTWASPIAGGAADLCHLRRPGRAQPGAVGAQDRSTRSCDRRAAAASCCYLLTRRAQEALDARSYNPRSCPERDDPIGAGRVGLRLTGEDGSPAILRRVTGWQVNDLGRASAYLALFSEIAIVLLVTTLLGVLAGYWLDQRLGTLPILSWWGCSPASASAEWAYIG